MKKFRTAVAGIVAVATLSSGVAACTPAQQQELGVGLGQLIGLWVYLAVLQVSCPPGTTHDCGP